MCVQQRQCAQVSSVKGNHTGRTTPNGWAKSRIAATLLTKDVRQPSIHSTANGGNGTSLHRLLGIANEHTRPELSALRGKGHSRLRGKSAQAADAIPAANGR